MTIRKTLNIAGILCGLIGVLIVFRWGPPQPSLEPYPFLIAYTGTPDEAKQIAETQSLRRKHTVLSDVGLAVIALGFGLQLLAELT